MPDTTQLAKSLSAEPLCLVRAQRRAAVLLGLAALLQIALTFRVLLGLTATTELGVAGAPFALGLAVFLNIGATMMLWQLAYLDLRRRSNLLIWLPFCVGCYAYLERLPITYEPGLLGDPLLLGQVLIVLLLRHQVWEARKQSSPAALQAELDRLDQLVRLDIKRGTMARAGVGCGEIRR